AEDGIRGVHVTGVQTCALPISAARRRFAKGEENMAEKKATGGARGGIATPVTPSDELAAIVGKGPLPRSEIVSKMWDYIRKNNRSEERRVGKEGRTRPRP